MAKYENSWDQYPQIVSLGAQKNFVSFMNDLKKEREKGWLPDEIHYKNLVAKALIFKAADKAARNAKIPSYKANVVTYMVAYLSKRAFGRLNLMQIWNNQGVSPSVAETFQIWAPIIHKELFETANGRNITEWCKKNECWHAIEALDLEMPDHLRDELDNSLPDQTSKRHIRGADKELSGEDKENIARTMQMDDKTWFEISRWGRKAKILSEKQCDIALTLSKWASDGWKKVPSPKQAWHAVKMIETAISNNMPGFSEK